MVPRKTPMTFGSFPIFDVRNSSELVYRKSVHEENGYFFLEGEQEYGAIKKLVSSLDGLVEHAEPKESKSECRFCDIVYDIEKNMFLVARKSESCPTKRSFQRNLNSEGVYLLNNIGGWHTFNEMLVPKVHYKNIFEINATLHEALLRAAISRWVVYRELEGKLLEHFDNFGKPFWLCMTTNDRLGASIFHFHTHVSLSPFEPKIALLKSEKLHSSSFARSENFEIGCFHGTNLEMVVRSSEKFDALDLTNEKALRECANELSLIRYFLLNLIKDCFEYPIPLTEGMFTSYLSKSQLRFLITPFFPYGALERYRDYRFFSSAAQSNANYVRRKITNNERVRKLMGHKIEVV